MARRAEKLAASVAALARATNVARSTARRWVSNGCPRRPDGRFDIDAVAAWVKAYRSRKADRTTGPPPPVASIDPATDLGTGNPPPQLDPLRDARTTREQQRIQFGEINLRRLRGELVERDQVAAMLVARANGFRRALRSVGRRLGRQCANKDSPREVQLLIETELDRILWAAYGRPATELDGDSNNGTDGG